MSQNILPTDKATRKAMPIARGVLDYFPRALAYVAYVSKVGNDQHNPGEPLHWAKDKSTDQADTIVRHLIERGGVDEDGVRHSGKLAWRALALLETELESIAEPGGWWPDVTAVHGPQEAPAPMPQPIGKWVDAVLLASQRY